MENNAWLSSCGRSGPVARLPNLIDKGQRSLIKYISMKSDQMSSTVRERIVVRNCRWIEIPKISDARDGVISVAEGGKDIPFAIRRVYYIYGLNYQHSHRGEHSHKKLKQVMFCINGKVTLNLDDGFRQQEVTLDEPHAGLYLGPDLWVVMKGFIHQCILLVFASDTYRESDYVRDHLEFVARARRKNGPL